MRGMRAVPLSRAGPGAAGAAPGSAWGAQDVSRFDKGAYTGEVSAAMLVEFGCRYAIVGHSERRTLFGETDAIVGGEVRRGARGGAHADLLRGRDARGARARRDARRCSRGSSMRCSAHGVAGLERGIVAYEPVWAIGTGRTATSAQAAGSARVHPRAHRGEGRRRWRRGVPILYGGSVKAANAAELFAMPDVDGGLVGGASLVAEEFVAIWRAAGAPVERQ